MVTAMYAAENILGANHDVWDVNVEEEYHEEAHAEKGHGASGERLVPQRVREASPIEILNDAFARYDPVALGGAIGTMLGFVVFLATAGLLLKGGEDAGATLALLGNYFPGYNVTWAGSLVGALWGSIFGYIIGFVIAVGINVTVSIHLGKLLRRLGVLDGPIG